MALAREDAGEEARMASLQPVWEILVGAAVLVAAMIIHGTGMYVVLLRAAHHDTRGDAARRFPERQAFFGALVMMMISTHLAEIVLWASVFIGSGAIASSRDAFYLAAVTYTTLGYEDIKLPTDWRLLAPLCAMTGVFAFGWTTGVMVSIVGRHFAPLASPRAPPPPGS
jgi:Ion channel